MGRVDSDEIQTSGAGRNAPIMHFTHPHELHPIPHNHLQNPVLCSGCKLEASGIMYTCVPCNFNLHSSCTQFPKLITHPSHPGCNLRLLPVSSYPGGRFNCDACNRHGDGFSYHCVKCDYDLHVLCAQKPLKIMHRAHSCPLELTFENPYQAKGFSCDVCRLIGAKQWLYRCSSCEFDVHLDCTKSTPKPSLHQQSHTLQHHHSFPVAGIPVNPNHNLGHSASTGSQFQAPPAAQATGFVNPANPQMGPVNPRPAQAQPSRVNGLGATLVSAAVQGFVEGVFQEIGQNVMEGVIGGGDNAGADGGADGY